MPTERYSRIRPNGADSGSRPSALAPSATPRSSGAPRCGVPSVTTSVTRSVQAASASVATAQAARMIRPPIECPTSAIRRTSVGQAATRSSSSDGERDAVLRDRAARCWRAGRPASRRSRRPAGCRSCRRSPGRRRSQLVSVSPSPCRNTTTSPVAAGNAAASAVRRPAGRRARRAAPPAGSPGSGCCSASRSPMSPLTAATTSRPCGVSSMRRAEPAPVRGAQPAAGAAQAGRRGRRTPPTRAGRAPRSGTPRGPAGEPAGQAEHPAGHRAVHVADRAAATSSSAVSVARASAVEQPGAWQPLGGRVRHATVVVHTREYANDPCHRSVAGSSGMVRRELRRRPCRPPRRRRRPRRRPSRLGLGRVADGAVGPQVLQLDVRCRTRR